MDKGKTKIYYVDKPFFKEAMMTFAFRKNVNWLEEGLSLLSWNYRKVAEIQEIDPDEVYNKMRKWKGTKASKLAGHRAISIGDIVVTGDNIRLVIGRGWVNVPEVVWKRINKI